MYGRIILERKHPHPPRYETLYVYGKYVTSCMINSAIQAGKGQRRLALYKERVLSLITSCHICPIKILAERFL